MTRSLSPSCFSTRARAAKRESLETRRLAKDERRWRKRRKEHREPRTFAVATMNQLFEKSELASRFSFFSNLYSSA